MSPVCCLQKPILFFSSISNRFKQVLASERRFRKLNAFQARGVWAASDPDVKGHKSLRDLKVGILGLGQMGTQIAKTFKVG